TGGCADASGDIRLNVEIRRRGESVVHRQEAAVRAEAASFCFVDIRGSDRTQTGGDGSDSRGSFYFVFSCILSAPLLVAFAPLLTTFLVVFFIVFPAAF